MRLFLTRHARPLSVELLDNQVVLPDEENHLSTTGELEANTLALRFARDLRLDPAFVRLVSSTLPRAYETTTAMQAALGGIEIEATDALAERNFAFPAGTTVAESRHLQEASYSNPGQKFPFGESRIDHRNRVQLWFNQLLAAVAAGDDRDVVVVCHGGTIEHLLMLLLGAPVEASASFFVPCDTAHYHVLESHKLEDNRFVWSLEGINVG